MDQIDVYTFLFHGEWQLVCCSLLMEWLMSLGHLSLGCETYCHGTPTLRGALVGVGFLEFFLWFQMIKGILTLITEVAQFIAEGPSFAV